MNREPGANAAQTPLDSLLQGLWSRPSLLAAFLAAGLYLPSLAGDFVYDDHRVILANRAIRTGELSTILLSDPTRPLLALSFSLNFAWTGLEAWSYHLLNLLLHSANAALAASLFSWTARQERASSASPLPALAGALFALTPMAVETVAYVSSRSTALCSLFQLAALRLASRGLEAGAHRPSLAALACFVLALLSKEEAASLPIYLLLLDLFWASGSSRRLLSRWRFHAPFFALPLAGLVARRAITGFWLPPAAIPKEQYLLTQAAAFPWYWLRAAVPVDPALYREESPLPWPPEASALAAVALGLALGLAAFALRNRARAWSFSVAWMAAGLLPSSSLLPLNEMVVDHRAYLGGAGVHYAVAGLAVSRFSLRSQVLLAGAFAARAAHYEWLMLDPVRIWEDTARRLPNSPMAQLNLAEAYLGARDPRAEDALKRGLALSPADPRLWTNLGALLAEQKRTPEAVFAMGRATSLVPGNAQLRENFALMLESAGQRPDAVAQLEEAIRLERRRASPRIHLARLLIRNPASRPEELERARALIAEARKLDLDADDARVIEQLAEELRRRASPYRRP